MALILRLDKHGYPIGWVDWQSAVLLYVKDMVLWTLGDPIYQILGGINRYSGLQSEVQVHSIIASNDSHKSYRYEMIPVLNNRELFRRDAHICMYCGHDFRDAELSRDHVIPLSKGGADIWTNVVTACKSCNHRKNDRTPEEANMMLKAVPFTPNYAEWLVLKNRKILADQMEFLKPRFQKSSRIMMLA